VFESIDLYHNEANHTGNVFGLQRSGDVELHCGKFILIPEDLGLDQPRFDTSHGDVGFGQLQAQSFRQGFNAMFCAGIGATGWTDFCSDNAGDV